MGLLTRPATKDGPLAGEDAWRVSNNKATLTAIQKLMVVARSFTASR